MRSPKLNDLPEPPKGKIGWPWTEESTPLQHLTPAGREWPRITIITPSFNQGAFIEETIRSVLLQGYPNLAYLIFDGGSTDNTVEIIKKYSPWLTYWVSEPDGGQSDAINRGLNMAAGEFATWINSDDLLCKNALVDHASHVGFETQTVYVGICLYIDFNGVILSSHHGRVHSLEDLVRIGTIWRSGGNIVQPEVLFPLGLALSVGGLDRDNHFTMDYELWGKFFLAGAKFQYTDVPFGMFRSYPNQKTQNGLKQTQSLLNSAVKLATLSHCSEQVRKEILADLDAYKEQYSKHYWRGTGRLAKIGLPPIIVNPIRRIRAMLQKDAR